MPANMCCFENLKAFCVGTLDMKEDKVPDLVFIYSHIR